MEWKKSGATEDDIIGRLRIRTVPNGYPTHRWSDSPDLGTVQYEMIISCIHIFFIF